MAKKSRSNVGPRKDWWRIGGIAALTAALALTAFAIFVAQSREADSSDAATYGPASSGESFSDVELFAASTPLVHV